MRDKRNGNIHKREERGYFEGGRGMALNGLDGVFGGWAGQVDSINDYITVGFELGFLVRGIS